MTLDDYTDHQLQETLRYRREARQQREFDGRNWHLHWCMAEFRRLMYEGVAQFPNVRELSSENFAAHPAISGSYGSTLLGTANCDHMNDALLQGRYARVLMCEHNHNAGRGVAFVAVTADPEQDAHNRHYHNAPLRLRAFGFHLCDHTYNGGVRVGHCSHDYTCTQCGWTYNVDSSG